jgi:hypothetical protein
MKAVSIANPIVEEMPTVKKRWSKPKKLGLRWPPSRRNCRLKKVNSNGLSFAAVEAASTLRAIA